MTFVIGVL